MQRSDNQYNRREVPAYTVPLSTTTPTTLPNPEQLNKLERYHRQKRRGAWLKGLAIVVVVSVIAIGVWQGDAFYETWQLSKQVPTSVSRDVPFPIYIPTFANFKPNTSTYDFSGGVLIFQAGSGQNKLTISQQAKTSEFDLGNFASNPAQTLGDMKRSTINGNDSLLATLNGVNIALIDTGKTIITITSSSHQSTSTMEAIVASIKKT